MRWFNNFGIIATTRRQSMLSGGVITPNQTNLGTLRRFVSSLEHWPNSASVTKVSGAVLSVEFTQTADSLTDTPERAIHE